MALVFTSSPVLTVPVLGAEECFPVHRIYCVGQNYSDHVKEMGEILNRIHRFFSATPPTLS